MSAQVINIKPSKDNCYTATEPQRTQLQRLMKKAKKTMYSTRSADDRHNLRSILLRSDGIHVHAIATDGHRVTIASGECEGLGHSLGDKFSMTLSATPIERVKKEGCALKKFMDSKNIMFGSHAHYECKLGAWHEVEHSSNYPNIKQIYPITTPSLQIGVDREALITGLEAILIAHDIAVNTRALMDLYSETPKNPYYGDGATANVTMHLGSASRDGMFLRTQNGDLSSVDAITEMAWGATNRDRRGSFDHRSDRWAIPVPYHARNDYWPAKFAAISVNAAYLLTAVKQGKGKPTFNIHGSMVPMTVSVDDVVTVIMPVRS